MCHKLPCSSSILQKPRNQRFLCLVSCTHFWLRNLPRHLPIRLPEHPQPLQQINQDLRTNNPWRHDRRAIYSRNNQLPSLLPNQHFLPHNPRLRLPPQNVPLPLLDLPDQQIPRLRPSPWTSLPQPRFFQTNHHPPHRPMNTEEFDKYFSKLNLKHFSPSELRFLGASNSRGRAMGLNTLPPKHLWPNLARVAIAADAIRSIFGYPITILSAYRSPAYNSAIKGVPDSQHVLAKALDLKPSNNNVEGLHLIAKKLRSKGLFSGGIGKYPTFVHIDVRGKNADW